MKKSLMLLLVAIVLVTSISRGNVAQNPKHAGMIQSGDLIVTPVFGSDDFLAYSKRTGQWRKHTFPKGVTVVPVAAGSVVAFSSEGREVSELIAVDRDGNWRTFNLPRPAANCVPIVSQRLAVFHVDGHAHAFSGVTGTWDSVPDVAAAPAVDDDVALILDENRIAAFSAHTGNWAMASIAVQNQ
jgi:hypothetical protein